MRTPFSPLVFCCFVCCGRGFIDPRDGDIGQTRPFCAVLPIYCTVDAGTVGTCTGSFSLGCQTSNTTAEKRQIHRVTAHSSVLWRGQVEQERGARATLHGSEGRRDGTPP